MQWECAIPLSLAEELNALPFKQGLIGFPFVTSIPDSDCFHGVAHENIVNDAALDLAEGKKVQFWCECLSQLLTESHVKMRGSDSVTELNYWRKIYTDSCLLRGISQFTLGHTLNGIATLDHALIIAGGYGRRHTLWDVILKMQSKLPVPSLPSSRALPFIQKITSPVFVQDTVPEIQPPSFLSFQFELAKRPFILRKFASNWPALNDRPWRSAAYLRAIAGPGRVVPVEVGRDYRESDWQQKIMEWDAFLSTLDFDDQPATQHRNDMIYLAQHDLTLQFPSLLEDILIPDYVYASLTSEDFPAYSQPVNDKNMLFNSWLGPKGTLSPAHTDPYFNCYVQVVGSKSVWLAPPSASPSMYPIASAHSELSIDSSDQLVNTSRVDVFSGLLGTEDFPDYVRNVTPISMTAVLHPGDVLFFPPGWWHAMRSETTSFSFSIWF